MTKKELLAEALLLDPEQRALLADEIRFSLSGTTRQEVDAAWLDEARRRDVELAAGAGTTSPLDDVLGGVSSAPSAIAFQMRSVRRWSSPTAR